MFVEKLEKTKAGYKITIDGKEYVFSEDVVVEYRFAKGHETTPDEVEDAKASEALHSYYEAASGYALRYGRSEYEVRKYLYDKNLHKDDVDKIILRMKEQKIINDLLLAQSLVRSYIHSQNGRNMIRSKLYEKGFSKEIIQDALDSMDMEEYMASLLHLAEKSRRKYDKYDPKTRVLKLKNYLLQRGYTPDEIHFININ